MSMKATLSKAVESAFKALGDLVQKGTLTSKSNATYNWTTGVTTFSESSATFDCVFYEESKGETSGNQPSFEVIVKNYDEDLSLYDTITISEGTFNIESLKQFEIVSQLTVRKIQ